jgi:hypothetical protein
MELREALDQIHHIRRQIAQTERFVGYRSLTTAFTGLVAIATACVQAVWHPVQEWQYLALWTTAAALSLVVVGSEMVLRCRRLNSALQTEATVLAAEQFIPCLVAGGLLTFVLYQFAPYELWLLPGLWSVIFSLGVFASRRFLPRGTVVVAAYYLLAGLVVIIRSVEHPYVFSPWTMVYTFGVGQLLAAALLWWSVERRRRT